MADTGEFPAMARTTRAEPKVFTRIISTPPGSPWRQARMAELEARQSAPLPLSDVAYRLKRLGFWDGGAARFAALYVRAADFTESFVANVSVDGATLTLRMDHPSETRRRSARIAAFALVSTVVLIIAGAGLATANARRERLTQALDAAEQQASSRLRQAQAIHRRTREAALLEAAARHDVTVQSVMADLNWAAANRIPEARIQAFHWQGGALALEALGPNPPIEAFERPLLRSAKPIRPGVWAWAAAKPASIQPAVSAPVSSDLR